MPPEDRDLAYLWDMLEAARTVRELVAGVPREDYLTDRKLQLAVERAIEIIGEAARRVSESFRCDHPELPWRAMIRQRHVLAHEYGEINQERIWNVATERVTELITLLEPLVPPRLERIGRSFFAPVSSRWRYGTPMWMHPAGA